MSSRRVRRRWCRTFCVLACALALPCVFAAPTRAATFVVNSTADAVDSIPGDGACATVHGACTLRAAVQEANELLGPHAIEVPAGTYGLTIPGRGMGADAGDLNVAFDKTLTIVGAGPSATIIDTNGIDRAFRSYGGHLELSGVSVVNGQADGDGGCFAFTQAVLILRRTTVRNCRTGGDGSGGAIAIGGSPAGRSALTLVDSAVTESVSGGPGGGVYVLYGTEVVVSRSTISENRSTYGGGVFITGGQGPAQGYGPAQLTLTESRIADNDARPGAGGGLYIGSGMTVIIDRSTISSNSTNEGGGLSMEAGIAGHTIVTVIGSTLTDNWASDQSGGGAFYVRGYGAFQYALLRLVNTTVSANHAAATAGAIRVVDGTAELTNVTITRNSSGTAAIDGSESSIEMRNTILAGNLGGNCAQPDIITDLGHNLEFPGSSCGFSLPSDRHGDPLLGPLADNGGPTWTHALAIGSPAIDAAAADACGAVPLSGRDQRHFLRAPASPCDIGAFELGASPALSGFTDDPLGTRATAIKATHVTELRGRIDVQRQRFALPPFQWTDTSLAGAIVRAGHLQELRGALTDAYRAALLSGAIVLFPSFGDSPPVPGQTVIRAEHIDDLRAAVLTLEGR